MNALLLIATAGIAGAHKLGHPSRAVSSSPGPHAVFLSYASQDAEAARRICEVLRPGLSLIKIDPLMASLKGDPRFKAILRKMKLPE